MKRFDRIKTIQLIALIGLTIASLIVIFTDQELYAAIARDPGVRYLALMLWIVIGLSFAFLFFDFSSYADLKRENTELDNAVYSDALTGIANRYSVDAYIGAFLNQPLPKDMGCMTIELTNLGEINKKTGHSGGDAAILAFAEILAASAGGVCFIGRNGGNKFVAIFRECSENRLMRFRKAVAEGTAAYNEKHADAPVRYCEGTAFDEGEKAKTLTELVALSDRRAWKAFSDMQKAENAGKSVEETDSDMQKS